MQHTEQFITERRYLKNVSPKTLACYAQSFQAIDAALDSRSAVIARETGQTFFTPQIAIYLLSYQSVIV